MMRKDLFSYENTKTFHINPLTKLNYSPVISNVGDNNSELEDLLLIWINDAAKENRVCSDIVKYSG